MSEVAVTRAPVFLCATRSEAAPLIARLRVRIPVPGAPRPVIWGRLDGEEPVIVGVSGMGGANAGKLTRWVLENTEASSLVWFGVCGGLKPGLNVGDLVVPEAVGFGDHEISPLPLEGGGRRPGVSFPAPPSPPPPSPSLRARILEVARAQGLNPLEGSLVEVPRVLGSPTEKLALGKRTGALVCDMESASFIQAVNEAAPKSGGLDFAVVRTVFDAAEDELPAIPDDLLDENGSVRPFRAAAEFLKRPKVLWGLGQRNRRALKPLLPVLVGMGRG